MVQVPKEDVRNNLLENGFNSFKTVGYRKTKISDLAKKSGITASTFYSYYESKSELLMEICTKWIHELVEDYFQNEVNYLTCTTEEKIRAFLHFSWIHIPKADNGFVMNFVEAFLEFDAKEIEKQQEYRMQDHKDFFAWFQSLMDDILLPEEIVGLGHMIRHTTAGLMLDYKINDEQATKDANIAIDSFVNLLKNTKRI